MIRHVRPIGLVSQIEAGWIIGVSRMWINTLVRAKVLRDVRQRAGVPGAGRDVSRIPLSEIKKYMRQQRIPLEDRRLFV